MSETDTLKAVRNVAIAKLGGAIGAPSRALARLGTLEARLANSCKEIEAAQNLRYRVFHEEMGAIPTPAQRRSRRDFDSWDETCDHLIVADRAAGNGDDGQIVATCRFLRHEIADATGAGFCSQGEFELGPLLHRFPERRFLELGRSCVLPRWRSKRTIELLWAAIWNYARSRQAGSLFGCASFAGTNCLKLAEPLSLLCHCAGAPAQWQVKAHPRCAVRMDWMTPDRIDRRRAVQALPPLIKGYLRLGAMFAREAAIDRQFMTVDVLVILPVERINPRYVGYYGENGERYRVDEFGQAAFDAGDSVSSA